MAEEEERAHGMLEIQVEVTESEKILRKVRTVPPGAPAASTPQGFSTSGAANTHANALGIRINAVRMYFIK